MEIKNKSVKDVISFNLEMFYKLDVLGIKCINTAIDYLSIYDEFHKHDFIKSKTERMKVVATRFRVSVSTVKTALKLMDEKISLDKK